VNNSIVGGMRVNLLKSDHLLGEVEKARELFELTQLNDNWFLFACPLILGYCGVSYYLSMEMKMCLYIYLYYL
jgi:hypothetical protein